MNKKKIKYKGRRWFYALELEGGNGLHITYDAMAKQSGATRQSCINRLNRFGMTPLEACKPVKAYLNGWKDHIKVIEVPVRWGI